jgi:hypothetical protein
MGRTFRRCRANSVPDLSARGDRWCLGLETGREAAPTGRCTNLRTHSRNRDFSFSQIGGPSCARQGATWSLSTRKRTYYAHFEFCRS